MHHDKELPYNKSVFVISFYVKQGFYDQILFQLNSFYFISLYLKTKILQQNYFR
ncbi:hypothetical protein HanRHA438_Chr07g0314711 [Helianthus annuus]|nr:hypothetical protein HanRHA438_Chr07g0314711 [Helianthus annuus]